MLMSTFFYTKNYFIIKHLLQSCIDEYFVADTF